MSRRREPRAAHLALQNYVAELEAHVRNATESLHVGQARVEAARGALARYERAIEKPVARKPRKLNVAKISRDVAAALKQPPLVTEIDDRMGADG